MPTRLIVRRLGFLVLVLFGLSIITFVLSHVVPSDPARLYAGPRASEDTVRQIRHQFGLDQSIPQQYWIYVTNLLHGDFGYSFTTRRPVADDLHDYLPATVELTLAALGVIVCLGVPLGVVSAVYRGTIVDQLSRAISITGVSFPAFWLALLVQLLVSKTTQLSWLPLAGRLGDTTAPPAHVTGLYTIDSILAGNPSLLWQSIVHLILPALVLGYGSLAVVTRMVRASMLEVMAQDYIRTARAKGLKKRVVVIRHALRNALLPATTVLGLQIGVLLGGAVLVESIFAWPGIGRYATLAAESLDYNAIMAVTLVAAFIYVLVNLAVDLAYMILDPRVSYE
ncbi:MAG TPA: ABC transporter permease [Chloroflexota bacterium]|nr:ABC transporter permease [Chloroflexota bacterium]